MRALAVACTSVLIAGAAATMLPASATATSETTGDVGQIVATVASIRPLPVDSGFPGYHASVVCVPKLNHFNRTQLCWGEKITVSIYNTHGQLVGTDVLRLIQSMQLAIKSTNFAETDTLVSVKPSGEVPGDLTMTLDVSCGTSCNIINKFPPNSPVVPGVKGTLDYSESIAVGAVNETNTLYTLNFSAPNYAQIQPAQWRTPLDYRCDDMLKGQRAGCVLPAYPPTLTTMITLTDIAANIKKIQTQGPGHYGRPGSPNPLHRLANPTERRKNQRAVCGRSVTGPPPPGKSCDEYPFASTYEGGTKLSKPDRGWAWVPTGQQDQQGPRLKNFYYEYRILDMDDFYVKV